MQTNTDYLSAFPHAPIPSTTAEARTLLEETRALLAAELRSSQALQARVAELETALDAERKAREDLEGVAKFEVKRLRDQLSRERDGWKLVAENAEHLRTSQHALLEDRVAKAARAHAREVIWAWRQGDRHVPATWTAAHPPDDGSPALEALATALGDDGFAAYSEAFRVAWAEVVEQIADDESARRLSAALGKRTAASGVEFKHGSGKVKI